MSLREDAQSIIAYAIKEVLPDQAVADALKTLSPNMEKIYLVAVGKAAWQMAKAASDLLGSRIEKGICITKYDHVQGKLPGISCYEAGHPVPDTNTYEATQKVLDFIKGLEQDANILFLLSGGGSALFEKPLIPPQELEEVTRHLLSCGADISEINTIRKRFSAVKGGKFAKLCEPRQMYCIILSDVLGDTPEIIASGPACADPGTREQAEEIIKKYHLILSEAAREQLHTETPKVLTNVSLQITGSVRELCIAAARKCQELGYETAILTDCLDCEAREAGRFLSAIARSHQNTGKSLAFVAGGETIVHLTGKGKGGRNQELVLAAAAGIAGLEETAILSVGSDGTDGPTDAAGGYCDGTTAERLGEQGISIHQVLKENDSYHALEKVGGLLKTGATGTNVTVVAVVLIKRD